MTMQVVICLFPILVFQFVLSSEDCNYPSSWTGSWFHLGFQDPLIITSNGISQKGTCVYKKDNQFIIEEKHGSDVPCFRCMVMYEKHYNVLQYKESYCEDKSQVSSYDWLCSQINGDNSLHSMFRKKADLIKCPFKGPHSFSYSKGGSHVSCSYPPSLLDVCSDPTKLQLRYQACTDVPGSEIAKENIECLASWKEGSLHYLVAKLNHSYVYTDEARYRCFLYKKTRENDEVKVQMAMSHSASCDGLWTTTEGQKTFVMRKLENESNKCVFPTWIDHHEWIGLDGKSYLHVNKKSRSLRLTNVTMNNMESQVTCQSIRGANTSTSVQIVAHVRAECDSGYVCLLFTKRDKYVIQMQYGNQARHPAEACLDFHFNTRTSSILTFISGSHSRRPCPFSGLYSLSGPHVISLYFPQTPDTVDKMCVHNNNNNLRMSAGCSGSGDLLIRSSCSSSDVLENQLSCHGQWSTRLSEHLILSQSSIKTSTILSSYFCMTYSEEEDGRLSGFIHSCDGVYSELSSFNITSSGPCLEALTGKAVIPQNSLSLIYIYVLTCLLFI